MHLKSVALVGLILLGLAVFFPPVAHATTVQNGSFEDLGPGNTLNRRGWRHFAEIPGWTGAPNLEIQSQRTLRSIDARDGSNYAELDTNQDSGIYQDISLGAGRYLLSFWYSPRVNDAQTLTNGLAFSVSVAGNTVLDAAIDGAPNPDYPHGTWTEVTGVFALDIDATVQLAFAATGGSHYKGCGNCGALIDDIAIAAIPLPAAGILLVAALGLLIGLRRRGRGV